MSALLYMGMMRPETMKQSKEEASILVH